MMTDIRDGKVGPRTMMILAVQQCDIPDRLSPDEIWALVDLVMRGYCGNGNERKRRLGKWYRVVQSIVNRCYELNKTRF